MKKLKNPHFSLLLLFTLFFSFTIIEDDKVNFVNHSYKVFSSDKSFSQYSEMSVIDGNYYVISLDRKSLKVYGQDGNQKNEYQVKDGILMIKDYSVYNNEIWVADQASNRVVCYSLEYNKLREFTTPFNFSSLHRNDDNIIFYNSRLDENNMNTIILTDYDLNVIESLYPREDNDISLSFFPNQRIQKTIDGVYFNPAGSEKIDKIDFDCNISTEFNGGFDIDKVDFTKYKGFTCEESKELIEELPIVKFLINKDFVMYENYIDGFAYVNIYSKRDSRFTKMVNRMRISGIDRFDFVGNFPDAVYNGKFYKVQLHRITQTVNDNIDSQEAISHIPKLQDDKQFLVHSYQIN